MADVVAEAKAMKERLKQTDKLTMQLKTDVSTMENGLLRMMKAAPQSHRTHEGSSNRSTILAIDEILSRVEGISEPSGSKRQQERKWKRMQQGGSSTGSVKPQRPLGLMKLPEPRAAVPAVHDKEGLVATQQRFDRLHSHAKDKSERLQALTDKAKKEVSEEATKAVASLTSSSSASSSRSRVLRGVPSGLASEERLAERASREAAKQARVDAVAAEIVRHDYEDFAIAKARRRRRWRSEKRRVAELHADNNTASSIATMGEEKVGGTFAGDEGELRLDADGNPILVVESKVDSSPSRVGHSRRNSSVVEGRGTAAGGGSPTRSGSRNGMRSLSRGHSRNSERLLSGDTSELQVATTTSSRGGSTGTAVGYAGDEYGGYFDDDEDDDAADAEREGGRNPLLLEQDYLADDDDGGADYGGGRDLALANPPEPRFDYASALDAVDQAALEFTNFAFPDDDLLLLANTTTTSLPSPPYLTSFRGGQGEQQPSDFSELDAFRANSRDHHQLVSVHEAPPPSSKAVGDEVLEELLMASVVSIG